MNINILFGELVGLAIISSLSALFIKLGVKLVGKKSIGFGRAFLISFVALLVAFVFQDLFASSKAASSILATLPAFLFFVLSWLFNFLFIKYSDNESRHVGKAFLVTVIQSAALFVSLMILSLLFTVILLSFAK